jgi:hypothetical protein
MKIKINPSTGLVKVSESPKIYLDNDAIEYLKKVGKLDKLEQDEMIFIYNIPLKRWEISDDYPVGMPGTIASVIFSIGGILEADFRSNCYLATLTSRI